MARFSITQTIDLSPKGSGSGTDDDDFVSAWHAQIAAPGAPLDDDGADTGTLSLDLTDEVDHVVGYAPSAVALAATAGGKLLTTYTSGSAGKYNITVNFSGTWTTQLQQVFVDAANRISAIVVGDLPDVVVRGVRIDDVAIDASLKAIDGVGGILGQAGATSVRSGSYLPATAIMQFDSADAQSYYNAGLFDEIVTHEMLHSIGVGSIWGAKGLVSGASFLGKEAVKAYNALVDQYSSTHGGSLKLGNGTVLKKDLVPLETGGGAGTAGSHWSENVFKEELMTGYLNAGSGPTPDPLSAMTAASLKDLGYQVSSSAPVDAYALR
jgi:hypothetical protein